MVCPLYALISIDTCWKGSVSLAVCCPETVYKLVNVPLGELPIPTFNVPIPSPQACIQKVSKVEALREDKSIAADTMLPEFNPPALVSK